jgi:hypothetical protein
MGKLYGAVLILAGVAVGAYALAPLHEPGPEIAAAQVAKAAGAPVAAPSSAPPAPAQQSDRAAPAPAKTDGVKAPAQPPASVALAAASPEAIDPPPNAAPPAERVDETTRRVPVGASKAPNVPPLEGPALTREIQRQLKRVGCYGGEISGTWSPSVRQAMQAFTRRVNASLPVAQPDPVLLAMVQSQASGVCNAACAPGQERAADGRCLPAAIAAKANKPHPGPKPAQRPAAKPAPAVAAYRPALEGRMSLSGPPPGRVIEAPARPRAKAITRSRAAQWRARERRRAARRQPASSGFWGFPFSF